jgi:KaiC domain protein
MGEERVTTGVPGLDQLMAGGLPRGHVVAAIGSFGTGKTTFALQFIAEGIRRGEKCMFISLEEDQDSLVRSAAAYGWDLKSAGKELYVAQLEPADMAASVNRLKSDLPSKIQAFGARRLVLDSVSLFAMLFEDEGKQRQALFQLARTVKQSGVTALFTAEAGESPGRSRDGLVEYVADGVISLRAFESESQPGDLRLGLQVLKMRRSEHERAAVPYEITAKGLVAHPESRLML